MHVNNYLWAYNIDTKKLSRVLSLPAGAEATGLQALDNLNGFSYIMSNFQHPGDEMIAVEPMKAQLETLINQGYDNKHSGYVGYVSGVPTMSQMLEWKDTDNSLSILRDLAEAKGATVKWNEADRSVSVTKGSNTLTVKVGDSAVTVNGQSVQLPYTARIENERTMIPTSVLTNFLNK
jgi:hypothetical protein